VSKTALSAGLVVTSILAVVGGWTVAARSVPVADSGPAASFLTICVVVALVTGILILRHQPQRWIGPLILLIAVTAFTGEASQGPGPASPVYGLVFLATILLPGLLVLSQMDALQSRRVRLGISGPILITAGLAVPIVLFAHGRAGANPTWWNTCPGSFLKCSQLAPARRQALPVAHALFAAHTSVAVVGLIVVIAVVLVRLLRADRASRRFIGPAAVTGLAWAVATGAAQLSRLPAAGWAVGSGGRVSAAPATFLLQIVPLLAAASIVAAVAWVELAVPRLQRTTAGLAVRPGSGSTDVTTYLASALGDPSVRVFFRRPQNPGWVDAAGRPASPAIDDSDRGLTFLERDGVEFGAIEYDASLASQPDAIELAVTAAAFALDSERLAALANARAEDARRLTARLVSSADAARDQLRAQLTAGPLHRLEGIEGALAAGGDLTDAARRLHEVAGEVRHLSHGLYPAELTEGGLAAVLTHATEVPAHRFSPAIEITVFLAADGDCDARITAEPGQVVIALSQPPRESTLIERVAVLGGAIDDRTIVLPVTG
jgi:hypothetical protein